MSSTTWIAQTPGSVISGSMLVQVQNEAAAAQQSAVDALASKNAAALSEGNANSSEANASAYKYAAANSASDASTFAIQTQILVGSVTPIPTGGSTGQSLVKNSDTDFDYAWAAVSGGGGGGGGIIVQDEGTLVLAAASELNFVGAGVVATDAGSAGAATVTIAGETFTQTQADALYAAVVHTHSAADITSGSLATVRGGTGVTSGLTALNASNLSSGTLPSARFPATLPAASGANLTALNATNLSTGTVATARLGSGSASGSTYLRGDGTWATVSGGGGGAGDALVANPLSQFAATTSAQLKGVISDETGSGALVFAASPTLTTPNIGTATGSVSGNAGTATKLVTARAINGVNFDGTSAITVADSTKLPLAGGTMSGAVNFADQSVSRPVFKDYSEEIVALGSKTGAFNVNYEAAPVQTFTLTGNATATIINPPASGKAARMELWVTGNGTATFAVTGSNYMKAGAPAAAIANTERRIYHLISNNAGTEWVIAYMDES